MSFIRLRSGGEIYYRSIAGNDDNPYLIFLHEGLGCSAMWKDFPDQLCHRTNCPGLLYDRLGYGRSSPLGRSLTVHYLHEYALVELPEIIAATLPDKPFILIGHSDGGSIGLIFAAEKPVHLQAVITEAAHVFVEPETVQEIAAASEAYCKGDLHGLMKYHGEKTDATFHAWADTWLSPWFRHWNIDYALPSIACPLLVIQGRQDRYGTDRQVEAIVTRTSGATRSAFVEKCGHFPHRQQAETVLRMMVDFIDRIRLA
jgi:pimeloyl-ACP methyl ester carboxylesterase